MKHPEIDDQAVAEQYVTGKLSPSEVATFEEHFLDCPQCIRAIEDAERLHHGLQIAAAEDIASREALLTAVMRVLRSRGGSVLLMLLVLIGFLPSALMWQRTARLQDDLQTVQTELDAERQPRANTPILRIVPTRSQEQPLQQITLGPQPEWLVLAVELGDSAPSSYIAELVDADGTVLWGARDLQPSFQGTLTLSLHSSLLPAETYHLVLTGNDHRLDFPLRLVRP